MPHPPQPPVYRTSAGFAPPLAQPGERAVLNAERAALLAKLKQLPPHSRLRLGLEHALKTLTTRLIALGPEPPAARSWSD